MGYHTEDESGLVLLPSLDAIKPVQHWCAEQCDHRCRATVRGQHFLVVETRRPSLYLTDRHGTRCAKWTRDFDFGVTQAMVASHTGRVFVLCRSVLYAFD